LKLLEDLRIDRDFLLGIDLTVLVDHFLDDLRDVVVLFGVLVMEGLGVWESLLDEEVLGER